MGFKAALRDISGLDEAVAKLYRKDEKSGLYVLDVEPAEGHSLAPVENLHKALNAERQKSEELGKRLKGYEGIDDPQVARDALQRLPQLTLELEDARKGKGDVEKTIREREAAAMERAKKDVDKAEAKAKRYFDVLQKAAHAELRAALAKGGAKPGALPLLESHLKSSLRLREAEDGNILTEVLGPDGAPRISPKDYSRGMSIEELVDSVRESTDFCDFFAGSGAAGGGSNPKGPSVQPTPGKRIVSRADMAKGLVSAEEITSGKVEFRD